MTDGSHITQLGGVKQEIQDLKSGSESLINQVKVSIDGKFSEINLQLIFASTANHIVTESIINLPKNVKTLKLGYLIWKKLQINMTSTLGEVTLKYMAYQ